MFTDCHRCRTAASIVSPPAVLVDLDLEAFRQARAAFRPRPDDCSSDKARHRKGKFRPKGNREVYGLEAPRQKEDDQKIQGNAVEKKKTGAKLPAVTGNSDPPVPVLRRSPSRSHPERG
jgi:hypothetical protein